MRFASADRSARRSPSQRCTSVRVSVACRWSSGPHFLQDGNAHQREVFPLPLRGDQSEDAGELAPGNHGFVTHHENQIPFCCGKPHVTFCYDVGMKNLCTALREQAHKPFASPPAMCTGLIAGETERTRCVWNCHQRGMPNSFSMSAIIGCVRPALRNSAKSSAMTRSQKPSDISAPLWAR